MEFKVIAPGGNELQIAAALPQNFKSHSLKDASAITGKAHFGVITFQHYIGDGFSIWYSNYDILHTTRIVGRGDSPILELHMQFSNNFETEWDGVGETIMKQYKYNLTYVPFINNSATFVADKCYQTFDVHFTVPYLERLAPYFPALERFLSNVMKNKATSISNIDRFLTPDMISMVRHILKCPFRDGAAIHYIESKVMELLLHALDDLSASNPLSPVKLSAYDIEMLHEAKRLIIEDFQNKLSLLQLSRKVGINDFKLKKGFKYLFGTTVGDYLQFERMARAKQMVLDKQYTFSYIAIALGYESESSFNKAFKKHFGVTPGYMRSRGFV